MAYVRAAMAANEPSVPTDRGRGCGIIIRVSDVDIVSTHHLVESDGHFARRAMSWQVGWDCYLNCRFDGLELFENAWKLCLALGHPTSSSRSPTTPLTSTAQS
jgi:hypothetical protein